MSAPFDLRLGRWQDVLADVECDALICDPPYSARVEKGFRTSRDMDARGMGYANIDEAWCQAFVSHWHPRTRSWMAICGDHITMRWWESALTAAGRYVFPPLPIVKTGAAPRLMNDGPASQAEYMIVARPKEKRFKTWGSLPGWYLMQTVRHGHDWHGVSGAKAPAFMKQVVRDYSRAGDLVCDPTAGSATTGVAALTMGRRFVGSECDPVTHEKARKRLSGTQVVDLFDPGRAKQEVLL